jgi:hypothetical protein
VDLGAAGEDGSARAEERDRDGLAALGDDRLAVEVAGHRVARGSEARHPQPA